MKTQFKNFRLFLVIVIIATTFSCAKPLIDAHVSKDIRYVSRVFPIDKETAYKAAKWALVINRYRLTKKDKEKGILESSWAASTSDSHAITLFNRRDLGVNGAYYQLIVHVVPDSGKTRIDVGSKTKAVASGIKSTGIIERRILRDIRRYLRVAEPDVSNIGLRE